MNYEHDSYDSDSTSKNLCSENESLVHVQWKPRFDGSAFVGNEKRIIRSMSNLESTTSTHPYLEFHEVDISSRLTISFWQDHGSKIKSIILNHCILDVNMFSCLLEYCTNLRIFEIHTSDLFVKSENPTFHSIFETLVERQSVLLHVEILKIKIEMCGKIPCNFDRTILNLLRLFPNFRKLTIIHDCDIRNFSNYTPLKTSKLVRNNDQCWLPIFQLWNKNYSNLEALNFEFSSSLISREVWTDQIIKSKYKLKNLTEMTFEMVPSESDFPEHSDWISFLKNLRNLTTISCKLLFASSPIESQFLNRFLRQILQNCISLQHLSVERKQAINGGSRKQWNLNFEFLRDILASSLRSFCAVVDDCDILLLDQRRELGLWFNDSMESLTLKFVRKDPCSMKQHETLAEFLSKFLYLKYLCVGGELNNQVLISIWKSLKKLEGLSLYFTKLSSITEAGFAKGNYFDDSAKDSPCISDLEALEFLKIEVENEDESKAHGLHLPSVIFKNFEFSKLRFLSIKTNNTDPDFLILLSEQLMHRKALNHLYINCKVEKIQADFWNNYSRYCPNLQTIYIKNNCPDSKKYSIHDYKGFFRFCTSLKLFIHENEKSTNRWFLPDGKKIPERITNNDQIYLIVADNNDVYPNFWP